MRRTSSRRGIRLHQGQNGRCTNVIEKIPKSECPDVWICLPKHTNGQNHGPVWKTQSFLLSEICMVILWQGLLWERQFEKILLKTRLGKFPNWECLFFNREKGLLLSVYVDDTKLAGKKQNINPTRKVLVKDVDLEEPTSCLDHVYLGCTQRECQISKDIVDNYQKYVRIKDVCWCYGKITRNANQGTLTPTLSLHGPMPWKVMQRNAWKDIANWRTTQPNNDTQSRRRALMTTKFKEEEIGSVGEMSTVCSQIVPKCLYLARIGRLHILWSANKTCSCGSIMDNSL